MNQVNRPMKLAIVSAVAAVALTGAISSASAQTVIDTMPATTSTTTAAPTVTAAPTAASTAGNLTSAAGGAKPPTSATPRMIDEAVQRSQARAAKVAKGVAEQWGSEEPFVYKPSPGVP